MNVSTNTSTCTFIDVSSTYTSTKVQSIGTKTSTCMSTNMNTSTFIDEWMYMYKYNIDKFQR